MQLTVAALGGTDDARGPAMMSLVRTIRRAMAAAAVLLLCLEAVPAAGSTATWGTFDVPSIDYFVVNPDGSIIGADFPNSRLYRVSTTGAVSVIAGSGPGGFDNGYSGDGGPALDAHFGGTIGLARAKDGSLLVVDHLNDVLRRIDSGDIVSTIAGSGPLYKWDQGPWRPNIQHVGDQGPALDAVFDAPWGITVDAAGNVFIGDRDHDAIRRLGTDGIITTVAGTGQRGYNGDGVQATQAKLNRPGDTAIAKDGSLLIADENNSRIRRVDAAGRITTFAGNGLLGCGGLGGPATQASLQNAGAMAVLGDGSVIVAQGECHQFRIIGADGIIRPFAGSGSDGCGAVNGALATSIAISAPGNVEADEHGNVFVSDPGCQDVLRIDTSGRVRVVADLRGLGG